MGSVTIEVTEAPITIADVQDTLPMPNNPIIDYSQYRLWWECPWKWYERYISQTQPETHEGQKNDALTLGSLTHKGLENFRAHHFPYIEEADVVGLNASPECAAYANLLVKGYIETYPNEDFIDYHLEEPLRFPVTGWVDGLAKVDNYFSLDIPTTIEDGLGDTFTLDPGVWVHEYKTKDASKNVGNYILGWKTNMQACFQILALQHKLGTKVNGLLINVLEKPGEYTPKHTCKECKAQSERRDWSPTGEGYSCPKCQHIQKLDISDKSRKERKATYYRFMVTRSEEELEAAEAEISRIATEMHELRCGKGVMPLRATDRCVHPWYGQCPYFIPHSNLHAAKDYPGFIQIDPLAYITTQYIGEPK